MRKFISKCLLRLAGWRKGTLGEYVPKCVICVAPHTSNWDLIIGKLAYCSVGRKAHFLIKKEWFVFPLNLLFKWLGGIPVDRSRNSSITDRMAKMIAQHSNFHLAVTPEGTRKMADEWKRGFYYIAIKANVPILLAYIDYLKKEVGVKCLFYPTGNADADISAIRACYEGVTARHPRNFTKS
ncbi:MAG: 1-acyl-sn-glycerol-3-phosphate acyltransferase [Tannerellaceae bacterium]|jgi:1-acyl-sn-glycerol-3-phosphate acyltransferase|nr:1-acyl-sn-glycerol-3-phosphate acyltransferase [Tannerellaceae bacterium]